MNPSDFVRYAGFVGALIVAAGYGPQIWHLYKQHCSAGISLKAWALWLVSGVLFLAHAVNIQDAVFITLNVVGLVAVSIVLTLARRYQGMT